MEQLVKILILDYCKILGQILSSHIMNTNIWIPMKSWKLNQ
jgi:hypothetical protein